MMAQTKTQTKPETVTQPAQNRGQVAVFSPPRLPFHPAIEERFGVSPGSWKVLVEATFPSAKTVDSVVMALAYCKQRNLDPFKKPVHIVPMWSKTANNGRGGYIETVWPGVSELRTTAFRTKNYAGLDAPEFGPMKRKTFKGTIESNEQYNRAAKELEVKVEFPEWCQITVHRELNGKTHKFVGPKVYWMETYAKIGKTDVPNDMWQKRASGQLEKCAEAAALRRAFPEEIGNELTAEEMEGQILLNTPEAAPQIRPPSAPTQQQITAPSPRAPSPSATPRQDELQDDREFINGMIEGDVVTDQTGQENFKSMPELLDYVERTFMDVEDSGVLRELWDTRVEPHLEGKFPPDKDAALAIFKKHMRRLGEDV